MIEQSLHPTMRSSIDSLSPILLHYHYSPSLKRYHHCYSFQAVSDKWNVFALDLMNEPNGKAAWGTGNTSFDWASTAGNLTSYIFNK